MDLILWNQAQTSLQGTQITPRLAPVTLSPALLPTSQAGLFGGPIRHTSLCVATLCALPGVPYPQDPVQMSLPPALSSLQKNCSLRFPQM